MASIDRLSKLFQALAHGDNTRAEQLAGEICAEEERKGHHSAARRLRGALGGNGNGSMRRRLAVNQPLDLGMLPMAALSPLSHTVALSDVYLKRRWRKALEEFILEWQNRAVLDERGIRRRSSSSSTCTGSA